MEFLPKNPMLEFHQDTLQYVRKLYNLDQPGRMDEAINIMEEWVKKQEHFIKKEFSRDFLERLIIANKGLLERSKMKLDKTCTLRTLVPHFFGEYNAKEEEIFKELHVLNDAFMPKMTPEHQRIYIVRNVGKEFSNNFFLNYYKRAVLGWEYILRHDYFTSLILILDLSEANFVDMLAKLQITELRQVITLFLGGYGTRIKGIHLITKSKMVDALVAVFKQVFSAKLGSRIYVHANIEDLHEVVPKEILPADYGGKEKPLSEIHEQWMDIISTKEHIEYVKNMNEARTDESRRTVDKFNEQYLGTPGTFRTFIVD